MRCPSETQPGWRSSRPPGIPPNGLIETPLVRRAEAGEAEAIADLLRRTRPLVERTVARLCIDLQLRDDLVQACLVVVYTDLPALRTPEAFVSWAQGIVRNVCRREVRRQGHSRVAEARVVHETLVGSGGGEALVDPEEVALRTETRAQLQRALAALPARYRTVVTMRAVHGYTYEEMGRILDAPSQLVRLWYFRGRHRLQVLCGSDDVLVDAASTRTGACGVLVRPSPVAAA
jgi:RNA polymerase sigma factor (sigma-70 family)